MPDTAILFTDFDDTLVDTFKLVTEQARELGALLAREYGDTEDDWAKQVADTLRALEDDYLARFVGAPLAGYNDWLETMRVQAVTQIFTGMGQPVPANARELAISMQFDALTACDAALPGAVEALRALCEQGMCPHLASGQESEYLRAALIGSGLEAFTDRKFGPDLVDCAKEGPEYYVRVFDAVGVAPASALVIDNDPNALGWARQVGARTIQAKVSPERHFDLLEGVEGFVTGLEQLPALIGQILGWPQP